MKPVFPAPLKRGDRVAIVSPASIIDPVYVTGACDTLVAMGYEPVVMPHALGRSGSFSGTVTERLDDMTRALLDPSVRAVVCSRGGYGAVHLLEELDRLPLERDPKWLVGFSDVSALHALLASHGVVSIHGSMAKGLARGKDHQLNIMLNDMLTGGRPAICVPSSAFNRPGVATGMLRGGNLAVLDALAGTRFDDLLAGSILVIEDIAEPIYKVQRMLYRLKLSGVLDRLAALVVGRFTEYRPDANYGTMEEMIATMVAGLKCPVAFDFPVGHVDDNHPWFHGAQATLSVTPEVTALQY